MSFPRPTARKGYDIPTISTTTLLAASKSALLANEVRVVRFCLRVPPRKLVALMLKDASKGLRERERRAVSELRPDIRAKRLVQYRVLLELGALPEFSAKEVPAVTGVSCNARASEHMRLLYEAKYIAKTTIHTPSTGGRAVQHYCITMAGTDFVLKWAAIAGNSGNSDQK